MKVREYERYFSEKIPRELSLEWDNDGLMCCPDANKDVKRVLVALDVTEEVVKTAVDGGYDLILSHHPMIFRGIKALTPKDGVGRKILALVKHDIAVMSFHTRLDAVAGGVNDVLASLLGLRNVTSFGEEGIGRIGDLPAEMTPEAFAAQVKAVLNAPVVSLAKGNETAFRVAVLGGSGKDDVYSAIKAGADTYVSGELAYHQLVDAPETGMTLITAGHFYTEYPVCERLSALVKEADPTVEVTVHFSDEALTI